MAKGKLFGLRNSKTILTSLIILFVVLSILVIITGSYGWSMGILKGIDSKTSEPVGFIAIGSLVIVFSIFGFYGVLWQSKLLLGIYLLFVLLLVVCQLAVALSVSLAADDAVYWVSRTWINADTEDRVKFEESYDCCGYKNYTDTNGTSCNSTSPFKDNGCLYVLTNAVYDRFHRVSTIAGVLGGIELFGLLLVFIVCVQMPRHVKVYSEKERLWKKQGE
eukprot:TRINITY_DN6617_c0_g1_i1.p1 TRINITY_DN6617_c0_g1~~TRINITY_DN6617_c0_g1_i1.p1  ORF type:complete len:245 (-),score=27.47 TRINITY_DN6617_c0_g1_i1:43-702(-)